MNPHSLFASAAINIGLAFIVLSLFSILKKQPRNGSIYYARRIYLNHHIPFHSAFALPRFLPSISWIPRAFRVTEDEIMETNGLDALVIIRLFKFGIRFFVVCSVVGLLVLVPINYGGGGYSYKKYRYHSLDSFTISNVCGGSNRLWVHFSCLWFISLYGLYLLYKEYKEILIRRIQQLQNIKHRPDQFTVIVREMPFCNEHKSRSCSVNHFFSKYYPYLYHSHRMLYRTKDLEELVNQAKSLARRIKELKEIEKSKKHKKRLPLLDTLKLDTSKLTWLEEKFQVLCHKIHQLQREDMLNKKELPAAFVTFKSRCGAAAAAQLQQDSHPLLWVTEMAPEPRDVSWRNMYISYRMVPLCRLGVIIAASLLTIFFTIPVALAQGIAKYEKLKKWFPPAMAIELMLALLSCGGFSGLSSVVTGYLPSVVLKGFIYVVPFAMFAMAKFSGCTMKSREEIRACNMVFYFLVGNVFFLSVLSGSLLDEIGAFISRPRNIPNHLARAVSAQADFFVTYILTDGLSGFSLEILQPGLLIWDFVKSCICCGRRERNPYLYSLPYYRIIPFVCLSVLIGVVYAVVAPLLLPFLIGYFFLGYVVYINQIQDVYETTYETCGQYWPYIHGYILLAIILMQITMIGLFGLKSKPAASISTIPLLLSTLLFNEYCKTRFLPSFRNYSLKDAAENDQLDEKSGLLETHCENAINAYKQPGLQLVNFIAAESSSTPLLSSS